jgi:hypothetical protein
MLEAMGSLSVFSVKPKTALRNRDRMSSRYSAALLDLHASGQPTELHLLPACRGYLRTAAGYITSREKRTLRKEIPEYELRAYLQKRNNWADQVYDSISCSTYRSAVEIFVVKLGHPSAYARDDTSLRLLNSILAPHGGQQSTNKTRAQSQCYRCVSSLPLNA